jgi:mono/diheme cytochrome c family protein
MAADSAAGKAVFDARCKSCHGPDGQGNPAIAKMMNGNMKPVTTVAGVDLDNVVAFVHTLK